MREVTKLDPTVDYSLGVKPVADVLHEQAESIEEQCARLEVAHRRALEREIARQAEKETP